MHENKIKQDARYCMLMVVNQDLRNCTDSIMNAWDETSSRLLGCDHKLFVPWVSCAEARRWSSGKLV